MDILALLPCAQHTFLHGFSVTVIDDRISSNVSWCLQSLLRRTGTGIPCGNRVEGGRGCSWQVRREERNCFLCRKVPSSPASSLWEEPTAGACGRVEEQTISGVTPPLVLPSSVVLAASRLETSWSRIWTLLSEDSQWICVYLLSFWEVFRPTKHWVTCDA